MCSLSLPIVGTYDGAMVNRLADETSPYLLQHRDNPVDWWPWSPEALAEAVSRDVPVLLSVGYSTCHWCHVMARESFSDPATAEIMNAGFVNIKVDREERPDIDSIYMSAVQRMTGRGGWPMTAFLTPQGHAFHAGTYYPPSDRHGMPSFVRVLNAITEAWTQRRSEVEEHARSLTDAITEPLAIGEISEGLTELAYRHIERSFDVDHGGFGGAPKFPQAPVLGFLLRILDEPFATRAAEMLRKSLTSMANGGIYDQIGGGFSRYSVDDRWHVPHFEKMLYDNALLARLYLWAGRELDEASFEVVARETLDYMLADLGGSMGQVFAAEDADSEGVEGKFYVWDLEAFRSVVGDEPQVEAYFGITADGDLDGANVLRAAATTEEIATRFGLTSSATSESIEAAKSRLLSSRNTRIRPHRDEKVVAAWAGLTISALADAGAALEEDHYLNAAIGLARFVGNEMMTGTRLARTWAANQVGGAGFLDDHAGVGLGMLDLHRATGNIRWYRTAVDLADEILARFRSEDGSFFSTANDAERLIIRPRDPMDNPSPSGTALAAELLWRIGLLTGETRYLDATSEILGAAAPLMERAPTAVAHHLAVAASIQRGGKEVAIVGPDADDLARLIRGTYTPHVVLAVDPSGVLGDDIPLLEGRANGDQTLAYVCEQFVCQRPVSEIRDLATALE